MFLSTCMHTFSCAYSRIVVNKDRVRYDHHACIVYCKLQDIVEYLCPVVLIVTTRNCISACMHCTGYTYTCLCVISVSACHAQQPKPIQETVHFQWRYWGECMLSVVACLLSFSFLFCCCCQYAYVGTKYYMSERRKPLCSIKKTIF